MDERAQPIPRDCHLSLQAAGAQCSWQRTMPQGSCPAGAASGVAAAHRSAAFVAFAVAALARTQRRRF
ncbi:MAG: hypothetical protein ACOY5Y_11720 [Pseudomonadota bacterium]